MSDQEAAAVLHRALQIVSDAGLDPNSATGGVALDHVLRMLAGRAHPPQAVQEESALPKSTQSSEPVNLIASWLDLPTETVVDFVEFGAEGVVLQIPPRNLDSRKLGRQRQLVLAKLGLDRIGYDRLDVPGSEINTLCEGYDCLDQNLPRNLEGFENYISRRGRPRAYTYRLTQFGLEAAGDAARRLLVGG